MKPYTFRPYYAFDCDSLNGFNNGHYLSEITVLAENSDDARAKALESLKDSFFFDTIDEDETELLDVDAAWTDGHTWYDDDGEEVTELDGTECQYVYQYLDLGEAEEQ